MKHSFISPFNKTAFIAPGDRVRIIDSLDSNFQPRLEIIGQEGVVTMASDSNGSVSVQLDSGETWYGLEHQVEKTAQVRNYTGHGWEGSNYNSKLLVKDIAIKMRQFLKERFPAYTFSVTSDHNSMTIALMSGPGDPFPGGTKTYEQLNQYYLDNSGMNAEFIAMFKEIYEYANSFNYDDSDAQIDYFDTRFYLSLHVGRWDRPYVNTAKSAQYTEWRNMPYRDESGMGVYKGYDYQVTMEDESVGYVGRVWGTNGTLLFETTDSYEGKVHEDVLFFIDDLVSGKTAQTDSVIKWRTDTASPEASGNRPAYYAKKAQTGEKPALPTRAVLHNRDDWTWDVVDANGRVWVEGESAQVAENWVNAFNEGMDYDMYVGIREMTANTNPIAQVEFAVQHSASQDEQFISRDTDWIVEAGRKAEADAQNFNVQAEAEALVARLTPEEISSATAARKAATRVLTRKTACVTRARAEAAIKETEARFYQTVEQLRRIAFNRMTVPKSDKQSLESGVFLPDETIFI